MRHLEWIDAGVPLHLHHFLPQIPAGSHGIMSRYRKPLGIYFFRVSRSCCHQHGETLFGSSQFTMKDGDHSEQVGWRISREQIYLSKEIKTPFLLFFLTIKTTGRHCDCNSFGPCQISGGKKRGVGEEQRKGGGGGRGSK